MEPLITLDFRELMAFVVAVIGATLWLGRLEWLARNNKKDNERLSEGMKEVSRKVEESERRVEAKVEILRQESTANFATMAATLEKIIFRLGEKRDRSEQ